MRVRAAISEVGTPTRNPRNFHSLKSTEAFMLPIGEVREQPLKLTSKLTCTLG